MNSIKKFAKSSGIFFIGNVLSKLTVFLLLPLCTRTIPPDDYGYYDLSVTYVTIATYILFFEVWTAVLRFMYDGEEEAHKRRVILSGLVIFAASSVLFAAAAILAGILSPFEAVFLMFLYGISHNIQQLYTYIARGRQKNVLFALSGIVNALVMVGLDLILILGFGMGYKALYIAYAAGNFAQVLMLEPSLRIIPSAIRTKHDRSLTKKILIYSLPLAVNSVAYWLLTSYNRTVISDVLSLAENGFFAVGTKFGSMISLVTTCFTFAWQDFSFSRAPEDSSNGSFFSKASEKYMTFLMAGTMLLLPCCKLFFSLLVGSDYSSAMPVIPLFIIVAAVSAYSTFTGNIFFALKDTKSVFISTVAACICNLLLGRMLIEAMGLNGANLSMLISFILNIGIRNVILYRRIGYNPKYTAVIIMALALPLNYLCYQKCGFALNAILLLCETAAAALYFRNDIKALLGKTKGKTQG